MKILFIISILSACVFLTFAETDDDAAIQKDVDDWLKRVHEFGEEWEKQTKDQPQFSNDWKKAVEEKLEEIRDIAQALIKKKQEGELTKKEKKTWKDKIKGKLQSIRKFGKYWKTKIGKKLREKFTKDWNKQVEEKIDQLIDILDNNIVYQKYIWIKNLYSLYLLLVDKGFKDKVKDMWDKVKDYGKKDKLDKLKMTKLPLPLDLEGVKIKYHNSKICVNQRGVEKCASKKDSPGQNKEVEKLFRVIHEYHKLQQNQNGGSDDDGGNGGDGGGDGGDGGDDGGDGGGGGGDGDEDYINDHYKKYETLDDHASTSMSEERRKKRIIQRYL